VIGCRQRSLCVLAVYWTQLGKHDMTTKRGPLIRLQLYITRTIMPAILHETKTDQQAAEETSREISRIVATALRAAGINATR
jgi:hypothetical protein